MKLAVITDTSAEFSADFLKNKDLYVLEVPISIDGVDYQPSQMTHEAWYELMRAGKEVPKTSQPSVAELTELLQDLKKAGYTHVLGLFLTSGISGFYQNAFYLQDFEGMTIKFPETYITSSPLGYMVETALLGAAEGKSFDEILARFKQQQENDHAFMLVDDLHWLAKGGRLSRGGEVVGSLLNIKPLLQFSEDGKVEVYNKVRTVKKAVAAMKKLLLEFADKDRDKVFIIHSGGLERAQELYDFAAAEGFSDIELVTFSPVVATHLGLGAVAYAMTPRREEL